MFYQPQDEWKIEQGFAGSEAAVLDQTASVGTSTKVAASKAPEKDPNAFKDLDRAKVFAEERDGWKGSKYLRACKCS
jgi:hypothetical protein